MSDDADAGFEDTLVAGAEMRESDRLRGVLQRAEELLMLRLEKPYDYDAEACLAEVYGVIVGGLRAAGARDGAS